MVSDHPVLGHNTAVWEDRVAWASPADGTIEIRVANLTTGNETVVTEIADPEGDVGVPSLVYDGRWVVWNDNRFGNLEVFAADTDNGSLSRLTHSDARDVAPSVSEGFAVWLRGLNVTIADLESGVQEVYREKTGGVPPVIHGSKLVWGSLNGTESTLHLDRRGDSSSRPITTVEDGGFSQVALGSDRVAWVASNVELDGRQVTAIENFTVETISLDGTGGAGSSESPVTLDSVERAGPVAASSDWVGWKRGFPGNPGQLRMTYMPTQGLVPFTVASTGGLSMSDDYFTFVGADNATGNRTGGHVYSVELHPPPQTGSGDEMGMGTWLMIGGGAALVGLGVFWAPIRRFADRTLDRGS